MKFKQNSKSFSMKIESIAKEKNISHMDAVLDYCHTENIERYSCKTNQQRTKRED